MTAEAPAQTAAPSSTRAAFAGALAGALALSATVLVDGLSASLPSLVLVVGQAIIRLSPGDLSRQGIETLGHADKPVLIATVVVVSVAIVAALGVAARMPGRRWIGPAGMAAVAALAVLAGEVVPATSVVDVAAPALVGTAIGGVALVLLLRAGEPLDESQPPPPSPIIGRAASRRRFLTASATALGGSLVLLGGGRALARRSRAAEQRGALALPEPASRALEQPADLGLDGLSPLVTPNRDFYRIDEALTVPMVDLDGWRLRISGMVDEPFELTMDDLLDEPMIERHITLNCVSNIIGGDLIGNALWLGVPLPRLLERAGVQAGADQVVGRSVDGFTVGFPTAVALDGRDAMVAVGMNGEPLPFNHGFPARLVVPGLYGYVSATKWLTEIELTTFDAYDAYWIVRGWAREAPVKTQARIDVPRKHATVRAGARRIAGVAWAQYRGIERVEVQVDDGPWRDAELGESLSDDSWRQWVIAWDAEPGHHEIRVRATDGTGEVQTSETSPPFPDGASGWHQIEVDVE